ncbi:serine esterase, cutinase [Mycolicibacterium mageritense DSM 44476 = CIP 104973]|uniref:Serine esterase n=2 Tax=Mycobacteriaceae TaxID=1762 RepID=A0ABN5Y6D1_MYCME|nr:serine esterase [Mycolicibacterium mageritense]CDO22115.1 serine esterase, cutinase [Mycolicibacterium mageritense DSM 44476 = CIP 104973]
MGLFSSCLIRTVLAGLPLSMVSASLFAAPIASAAPPCPDVEVVFARGTFEPPGVGGTGQAFVDALTRQLGDKSVEVYPVNYPASLDFPRAADGIIDASNKIRQTAADCPSTKTVLGGFSQGAAVAAYITADSVPANFVLPEGITGPLPADVADHVAAVALFGKPSNGFMNTIQSTAPPITIGHRYTAKTVEMCVDGDPVCSADPGDASLHSLYASNGMADQAASFVAQRVNGR